MYNVHDTQLAILKQGRKLAKLKASMKTQQALDSLFGSIPEEAYRFGQELIQKQYQKDLEEVIIETRELLDFLQNDLHKNIKTK